MEMTLVFTMQKVYYDNIKDMTTAIEKALDDSNLLEITKTIHKETCTQIMGILQKRIIENFIPNNEYTMTIEELKEMLGRSKANLKLQRETVMTDLPTSDLREIYEGHLFNVGYLIELWHCYQTTLEFPIPEDATEHNKAKYFLQEMTKVYNYLSYYENHAN